MISVHLRARTAALSLAAMLSSLSIAHGQPQHAPGVPPAHIPGELIVKFRNDATDDQIGHGLKLGQLKVKRHLQTREMADKKNNGLTLVTSGLGVEQALERLKNHPAVELVEPNFTYQHQLVSNDPYVNQGYLWGAYGDLSSPANSFGSQAAEAWQAGYTGTNTVYVAVIDEGIEVSHPDLVGNIWKNPFDPVDGLDNDNNGYVDDVNGWDFAGNRNNVFDAAGDTHGTHVAGTIGAKGGNGMGIAGVNWHVSIIAGKFLNASGGTTFDAIEAIDYFIDLKKRHGLNLVAINASWGGSGYSQALHDAIIRAAKANILFVAAAGNSTLNNDVYGSYPASIDTRRGTSTESAASYDAVISVAAIDGNGVLAAFSNYGSNNVDLGAPGVRILSTYPGSSLAYMDGTSMAAPHVTGAAALFASTHPGATAQTVRTAILSSVLSTPSLAAKTVTGGRLDLSNIIAPVQAAPTGVSATSTLATVSGSSTVTIRWNASTGATGYTVKRSGSPSGPWSTVATGLTGTSYSQNVAANGSAYHYVIVATGSSGESANSSVASITAMPPTPAGLAATAASSSQVQLKWKDQSADEQGFKPEYWTGYSWAQLGTVAAGATSVNITGTASRTTYWFRVRAYKGTVNTSYSNVASVTTP